MTICVIKDMTSLLRLGKRLRVVGTASMSGDGLELLYLEDGRADEKYKKDELKDWERRYYERFHNIQPPSQPEIPKNELGLCEAELKLASNTTDEEFRERYQKDYSNSDKL